MGHVLSEERSSKYGCSGGVEATFDVKIICDYQEFQLLKGPWDSLLQGDNAKAVWLRHEWYDCWWQAFGTDAKMFVVASYECGCLIGVIPLMIVPMRIKRIRQRVLRFIENGITPRSSLLFPGVSVDRLKVVWDKVFQHSFLWDLAILANLEQGNRVYDYWRTYLQENKIRYIELPERISPYVELTDGWEEVKKSFGRNLRRNINRAKSRLEKEAPFELVECVSASDVTAALTHCFRISKLSWKGKEGANMGGNEQRSIFYDLLTKVAINNGWINIWLLKFRDQYIAFEYVLQLNGYAIPIAADYDQEFKEYSPGVVLRSLVLERLIGRGTTTYDFAGTVYDYKLYWTKTLRPHSQFWLFHDGMKSRVLYLVKARVLPAIERLKSKPTSSKETQVDSEDSFHSIL